MKKTFGCLTVLCIMAFCVFGIPGDRTFHFMCVDAAAEESNYLLLGDEPQEGNGWVWIPDTRTLNMNDAVFQGCIVLDGGYEKKEIAINIAGENNVINGGHCGPLTQYDFRNSEGYFGIISNAKLNILGNGTLYINTKINSNPENRTDSCGIFSQDCISILDNPHINIVTDTYKYGALRA